MSSNSSIGCAINEIACWQNTRTDVGDDVSGVSCTRKRPFMWCQRMYSKCDVDPTQKISVMAKQHLLYIIHNLTHLVQHSKEKNVVFAHSNLVAHCLFYWCRHWPLFHWFTIWFNSALWCTCTCICAQPIQPQVTKFQQRDVLLSATCPPFC